MTNIETPSTDPNGNRSGRRKTSVKATAIVAIPVAAVVTAAALAAPHDNTLSEWKDAQHGTHEAIQAGSLSLTLGTDHGWFDVTNASSTNPAIAVDPTFYPMIPGDSLEKAQEISVGLQGDNVAAELTANVRNFSGALATQGLSGTIRLVKGPYTPESGAVLSSDVIATTPIIANAAAPQFTFNRALAPADEKYTVVTDVKFSPASVLGQDVGGVLEDITFNLKQVRPTASQPWVIQDSWLAYYVSQKLGIPQEKLTRADALQLTSLNLTEGGGMYNSVASLEGMQYATNLTSVDLSWTKVSDVSPLDRATKMTDFTAKHASNLTSIDPLADLKLVNFNTEWTQINSVAPLGAMDTLQNVDMLGDFALTDISGLAGKPNLTTLSIGYAPVTSAEALRYDDALIYLNAQQTGITDWSPVAHVTTVVGIP